MARTFVITLLFICAVGCSKRSSFKVSESEQRRIDSVGAEYNRIEAAADSGHLEALIRLYDVARDDQLLGVEYSEVAIIRLTELLYYETEAWIDAFSKMPPEQLDSLEKFQPWAYIGEIEFQDDSTVTQDRYRRVILARLDRIHGSPVKTELVRYLQQLFRAASDSDRVELERKHQ